MDKLPTLSRETIESAIQSFYSDSVEGYSKDAVDRMIVENPNTKLVLQLALSEEEDNKQFVDGYLKGFVQCYHLLRRQIESDEMTQWLETPST